MLLLYYLLGERAEKERKRLLIDTLLTLSTKSAASVCRKAGVQAANLSRFRKPGGEKQVSEQLQDRLLDALDWGGGVPSLNAVHHWRVIDQNGLAALEWIFQDRSSADSRLERKVVAGQGYQQTLDSQWHGSLAKGGAPCTILIRSGLSLPSGQMADDMMATLTNATTRQKIASQLEKDEKERNNVAEATLRSLLQGDLQKGWIVPENGSFLAIGVALGLPFKILEEVAQGWTSRFAREEPVKFTERLSKIDSLQLGDEQFSPSSMTKSQLELLVQRLASC